MMSQLISDDSNANIIAENVLGQSVHFSLTNETAVDRLFIGYICISIS